VKYNLPFQRSGHIFNGPRSTNYFYFYIFGVFVVLLLEKGFEGRHEHGGFTAALTSVFESADIYHVWLNFICLSVALLSYNVLSVVRKNLGKGALLSMFIRPLPDDGTAKNSISEGNQ
jgi:hypothetical protein